MTFGLFNLRSGIYGDTNDKMLELAAAERAAGLSTAAFVDRAIEMESLVGGSIASSNTHRVAPMKDRAPRA